MKRISLCHWQTEQNGKYSNDLRHYFRMKYTLRLNKITIEIEIHRNLLCERHVCVCMCVNLSEILRFFCFLCFKCKQINSIFLSIRVCLCCHSKVTHHYYIYIREMIKYSFLCYLLISSYFFFGLFLKNYLKLF